MVRYSITIFKRLKKRRHTDVSYKEVHVPEDWGVDRLGSETITLKVSCNSESLFDKEFNINNDANKIKEVSCPVCKKKLPIQIGRGKIFFITRNQGDSKIRIFVTKTLNKAKWLILGGYLLFSTFPIALVVAYNLTSNDVIKLLIWLAVCLVFGTVISLVSSAMIEKRITRLGNLGFFAQNREISSSVFKPLLRLPLWTKIDFETGPYRICNLLNIPNILNWKNSSFDSKS